MNSHLTVPHDDYTFDKSIRYTVLINAGFTGARVSLATLSVCWNGR